jgi:hypothetical protein
MHYRSCRLLLTSIDRLQVTMRASPIKTSTPYLVVIYVCGKTRLTLRAGQSTAGKTMSITTSVS